MKNHGIQLSTVYYSGLVSRRFVPMHHVQHCFINEGIIINQVIYYLALAVKGHDKLILPFENLFPRFKTLMFIFQGTRAALYGEPDPDPI